MHDPKLIKAMARAIGARLVLRGSVNDAATDAISALCTLRPDVAAVLRGEAAAVPKEPTNAMLDAAQRAWTPGMSHAGAHELRYRAMLAASPYAAKETPDAE